jgi:hypothetical protein
MTVFCQTNQYLKSFLFRQYLQHSFSDKTCELSKDSAILAWLLNVESYSSEPSFMIYVVERTGNCSFYLITTSPAVFTSLARRPKVPHDPAIEFLAFSAMTDSGSPDDTEGSPYEVLIESDGTDELTFSPDAADDRIPILDWAISSCEIYLPRVHFSKCGRSSVRVTLPTSFIPDQLAAVNCFNQSATLAEFTLSLSDDYSFNSGTISELTNPVYGPLFPGRFLVSQAAMRFCSPKYTPKKKYNCQLYVMEPQGILDDSKIAQLVSEGYSPESAARALVVTHGNLKAARQFLTTGVTSREPEFPDVNYRDCPLFYFILEVTESILNLSDHCCICGKPLGISVLRPSLCDDHICFFGATELGLCAQVSGEIRRGPLVADFLVSLASSALDTKWYRPPLPESLRPHAKAFFAKLPAIRTLTRFTTDAELKRSLGEVNYEILRFILMSNRCHLLELPPHLKMKQCANETEQLLCVNGAPELELQFQQKLKKSSRQWLWHGSTASRWHSILHTGLQDLGSTSDRINGGADYFGPGVYQSQFSQLSILYAQSINQALGATNVSTYAASQLGANLIVLALIENVKNPLLKQVAHDEWTQQDVGGLIVRCLLVVKKQFQWDLVADPKAELPSFATCMRWVADHPL